MKIDTWAILACSFASFTSLVIAVLLIVQGPLLNRLIGVGNLLFAGEMLRLAWQIHTGRRVYRYRPTPASSEDSKCES